MHWIFWIAIISFFGRIKAKSNDCERMNKAFALNTAEFIQCVAKNDQNATYCLNCSGKYSNAAKAYLDLINDAPNANASCRREYVDNNLLNLVDTLMSNTKHIWDMAVCSDCFEGKCDGTTAANCVVSNRTIHFQSLHEAASVCIDNNLSDDPCHSCNDEYNNLTIFYNKIRKETKDTFCFDLKNMMNRTQLWYSSHCCNEKNPPAIKFYTMSASSFFIAILFYGVAFLYGRRKPEIPYIPDDLLPIDHSRSAHDSSVSLSDNEQPTTSANILEPSPKLVESTDDSDNDDEPIIFHPISNPSLIEFQ